MIDDAERPRPPRQPPPVFTFTGRVVRTTDLTHDVREIAIALIDPPQIRFAPGQFVSFEIERPGARFKMTRAYSMVSPPDVDCEIVLLLNHVTGGPGSEYLFGLAVGDETRFRGPYGAFTLAAGQRDLLFVAADTGIAPIRSMLSWLATHQAERTATLIWGLESRRDLYYQRELDDLRDRLSHFSYTIALSQPDAYWTGTVGRVPAIVEARVAAVENLEVFICGGSLMIADVAAIIKRQGLCPIRREQYYVDKTPSPT